MKVKNIPSQISAFLGDPSLRSMLIDGPWGCGKTYQIRNYIEENKKNKVYYVSLFGFETVDEINTDLFYKVNKKKWFLKRGLMTVSKAIPAIPYVSYSGDAISYALGLWRDNVKGKAVVIFDDFERVGENLNYDDILGYFSHLFLSGVRVICVCDSSRFDKTKCDKFNAFKEKVFDKLVTINEKNSEIIESYFQDLPIDNLEDWIFAFDDNLRNAERTARLYREVLKYCSDKNFKILSKFLPYELLLYCINTIKATFDCFVVDSKTNGADYSTVAESVGSDYASKLSIVAPINKNDDVSSKQRSIMTYRALMSVVVNCDYSQIDGLFVAPSSKKERTSVFLLSDKNKKVVSEEFIKDACSGKIKLIGDNLRFLADILRYSDTKISNETRLTLIHNMIINYVEKTDGPCGDEDIIFTFFPSLDEYRKERLAEVDTWKSEIKSAYFENQLLVVEKGLLSAKESGNYSSCDHYIRMLRSSLLNKDDSSKKFLIDHDFLLPDLSGDITESEWSYSHSLADLARQCGLEKEMLASFKKVLMNDPKNESLQERLRALTIYKLGLKW